MIFERRITPTVQLRDSRKAPSEGTFTYVNGDATWIAKEWHLDIWTKGFLRCLLVKEDIHWRKSRWSRNLQNSSKNGCFCASSKTCVALHIFGRRLMAVAIQSLRILGHFTCFSEFSQLCGHWCNAGAVETVEHTNWLLCQCCWQRDHRLGGRFHLELPFDSRWRQVLQNCFCGRILNTGPPFSWHCAYTIKNEQIPWKAVVWRLVSFWDDNFPEASVFRCCLLAHFPDESASEDPRSTLANGGKARSRERALTREEAQSFRYEIHAIPKHETFKRRFSKLICHEIQSVLGQSKILQISSNFFLIQKTDGHSGHFFVATPAAFIPLRRFRTSAIEVCQGSDSTGGRMGRGQDHLWKVFRLHIFEMRFFEPDFMGANIWRG